MNCTRIDAVAMALYLENEIFIDVVTNLQLMNKILETRKLFVEEKESSTVKYYYKLANRICETLRIIEEQEGKR